jgi:hypothetical protein
VIRRALKVSCYTVRRYSAYFGRLVKESYEDEFMMVLNPEAYFVYGVYTDLTAMLLHALTRTVIRWAAILSQIF